MEKISLLLLIAKKTLIGSVIAGVVAFSGFTNLIFENSDVNSNKFEQRASKPNKPSDPRKI
jgi:hypothetical protein